MWRIIAAAVVLTMGAGCVPARFSQAPVLEAEELDFAPGVQLAIDRPWSFADGDERLVVIDEWTTDRSATLSWSMTTPRETEASKEARANASNDIGAGPLPEPVYENVEVSGSIVTDALNNAERIFLPAYWPEGATDVAGEMNSVLWLSRQQYDELVDTRASHIQLGLFDTTLHAAVAFTDNVQGALVKLQGNIAERETSNRDFTRLEADGDWSEYVLNVNGEPKKVRVIRARNVFGSYLILANPENPLIVQARIRPWALGFGMFSTLSELRQLIGYSVTSVTYPVEQPSDAPASEGDLQF